MKAFVDLVLCAACIHHNNLIKAEITNLVLMHVTCASVHGSSIYSLYLHVNQFWASPQDMTILACVAMGSLCPNLAPRMHFFFVGDWNS